MKNGDKILCPHCGEKSFAKEKKSFAEDFSLAETAFCCALCGGKLSEKTQAAAKAAAPESNGAADRLAALLGEEKVKKAAFAPDPEDGRNCLHCRHYIKHPFMDRCGLLMKEISVMDSCGSFEKKEN